MNFEKSNAAGNEKNYLFNKKLNELNVNETYIITDLNHVKTRFGYWIVVDIDHKFSMFLRKRIFDVISEDEKLLTHFKELAENNKLGLKYLGEVYNHIEFVEL